MTGTSLMWRSIGWLVGSTVGGLVVALPDSDDRVFSFSQSHGPSPLDLVGVVILVGSWLPIAVRLPSLWRMVKRGTAWFAGVLAVLGTAALLVTIGADLRWWWLAAVAVLVGAQLVLLTAGWRLALAHPGRR
jgi:hypothetical protein